MVAMHAPDRFRAHEAGDNLNAGVHQENEITVLAVLKEHNRLASRDMRIP